MVGTRRLELLTSTVSIDGAIASGGATFYQFAVADLLATAAVQGEQTH